MTGSSEYIRRKYHLRKMILSQKIVLPRRAALPFVGPDCAYHLYRQSVPEKMTRL